MPNNLPPPRKNLYWEESGKKINTGFLLNWLIVLFCWYLYNIKKIWHKPLGEKTGTLDNEAKKINFYAHAYEAGVPGL